jgi:hypothetical protein
MSELKQKAISLGLCEEFQASWSEDLIGMYVKNCSWCLKRKYPSLADMFPYDKELEEKDVYNSRIVNLLLTNETYILNNCTGTVEIDDFNVSCLYVSLDSVIEVNVKDSSILMIEAYDNSVLRINVDPESICTVWRYGNSAIQILSGNVKIIQK